MLYPKKYCFPRINNLKRQQKGSFALNAILQVDTSYVYGKERGGTQYGYEKKYIKRTKREKRL